MRKTLKKGERTRSFEIIEGKVNATLLLGGLWVSNPTEDEAKAGGWLEVEQTPEPEDMPADGFYYAPSYELQGDKYVRVWTLTKYEEEEVPEV